MKGKFLVGMVLAATVFSLAGCGVKEKKEMKADKVSVSEGSGRTLEERKEALFKADIEGVEMTLSKNCLYSSNEDGYITQWNRKGEKVSSTRKDEYELNACSDKRLICSKNIKTADGNETEEIYSIPIKQTESGEQVQWDQEEKVASVDYDDYGDVFLCEPYLIYESDTLTRLNLETKEKKTMKFDMFSIWFDNSCIMDGQLYLVEEKSDGERVYCIRIDDWTSEKLYENKTEGEICDLCIDGQSLYVLVGARAGVNGKILCYDMEKRKVVGQLSYEKIDALLQKEGVSKSGVTQYMDEDEMDLFAYEGRLYVSISDMCITSKMGEEYGRWGLLSCSAEGMTELQYEREISEWCYKNSATYGDGDYYDVMVWQAYEDELYFTYGDKQEKKDHMMRYHLDTKKWEKVQENELVYRAAKEIEYI